MLELAEVDGGYGAVQVLRGLGLSAKAGQITCVMGRNGAGKTTMLLAIMGQVRVTAGRIVLDGQPIHHLPAHEVPGRGIGYVPQGRRLFGPLTVAENIEVGLMTRRKGAATREHVLNLFPRLRERLGQTASTLSGGEQQMLAIARALCLEPAVLLLDEPTEGLQPSMITLIRETILSLKAAGVAVVLVEQRVDAVLSVADHVAFVSGGRVAETLPISALTSESPQFERYVGV
ncbi:amino acid/amide ABC transporter ATP-binding protein 2, HAAT family [Gemmobacter megaterium]|uniref:Amino acid/amide ABC transporter ATP-binding protein 2, HAAT family n=1 Tax=Gemmobacter megaterium TaxID=1086013 RepID=A0A1N7Q4T3_9RHOB|nr:ABC transporter ATP-binding protein [Gemmobacter megaterium]GGE23020.1 ABC transporter ATP-binding protein [Gemmobacter megaterium]SIT17845.1 amino acid/amide ABC transporter ATP-binding protein 2, HAAT family [Gemmobacter megaterium]